MALELITLAALFHLFDAIQGIAGFILRGYKVTLAPMVVYGLALWGVGLAGGDLLAYRAPPGWPWTGAAGFWLASGAGLVLAASALTWIAVRVSQATLQGT